MLLWEEGVVLETGTGKLELGLGSGCLGECEEGTGKGWLCLGEGKLDLVVEVRELFNKGCLT